MTGLLEQFLTPPREYTLVPFWFLNDELDEEELCRQIDDFEAHGVYGFVLHPRIGLPETIGFVTPRYFHFLRVCVEQAAKRDMFVLLYDEGMYPSGSCAGHVVAHNPMYAARCLQRRSDSSLGPDEELIHHDEKWWYVHCRSMGTIRGLHWDQDDCKPNAPPAADLLNPAATACFRELTLDTHYDALKEFFGNTIRGFFTDEPSLLGRKARENAVPWTWGFDRVLKSHVGEDFRPYLPALFDKEHPEHARITRIFRQVVLNRLMETYYEPYSRWCEEHGVVLTGHPAGPCDIGVLRYFHIPGQDLVWRYVEPFRPNALEGEQSVMAKCSSSAQHHYGRRRNLNECFGAYGWNFTYDEMKWITNWLFIRGVNLLVPHAFYYSLRGERRNERPPDVGPHSPWWNNYTRYADYCRRLCWLLGDSKHICHVAILGNDDRLPWRAARVLYERQCDFNYVNRSLLLDQSEISTDHIRIRDMVYRVLIVDGASYWDDELDSKLTPFKRAGRVVIYGEEPGTSTPTPSVARSPEELVAAAKRFAGEDVSVSPANPHVRYIHVEKEGVHFYLFSNEGQETVDAQLRVATQDHNGEWWDPESGRAMSKFTGRILLAPYQLLVLAFG